MLSTGSLDLPDLLGRFHRTHPGVVVRLRLAPGGSAELAREVIGGSLDLALLSVPGQPPAGLTVHVLSEEPLLIVCRPDHPIAAAASPDLGTLAAEPFIDFPPGWGNRAVVDRAFAAAGLDRQVLFEVADFITAAALVRQGLGVAFVPASAMAPFDGLASAEVDGVLRWRVSVATPAGRRAPAAVTAFLAELRR